MWSGSRLSACSVFYPSTVLSSLLLPFLCSFVLALCYDSTLFSLFAFWLHLPAELFQGLGVTVHTSNSTHCASRSVTSWAAQTYTSVFPFPSSRLCAAVVTCFICTCYTTRNTLLLFFISTINLLLIRQMTKENVYVHQQTACWCRAAAPLSSLCATAALLPGVVAGDESLASAFLTLPFLPLSWKNVLTGFRLAGLGWTGFLPHKKNANSYPCSSALTCPFLWMLPRFSLSLVLADFMAWHSFLYTGLSCTLGWWASWISGFTGFTYVWSHLCAHVHPHLKTPKPLFKTHPTSIKHLM